MQTSVCTEWTDQKVGLKHYGHYLSFFLKFCTETVIKDDNNHIVSSVTIPPHFSFKSQTSHRMLNHVTSLNKEENTHLIHSFKAIDGKNVKKRQIKLISMFVCL